ncbi:hypothetical protein DAPPUDRAFT_262494 [Daphnia pulex]|uniref:Uncharacterized protein n=1 Tax=Daphnia pulex TaxID=6669 RepID=E9HN39_DAPPU|nr:hypothetical protein DAPPUDRAFT_262494 [Daphnia pulex]|eukprot:EFX66858.1 hypothetical protein DAPPUDRAFT_262494 [Daphnia pulex]
MVESLWHQPRLPLAYNPDSSVLEKQKPIGSQWSLVIGKYKQGCITSSSYSKNSSHEYRFNCVVIHNGWRFAEHGVVGCLGWGPDRETLLNISAQIEAEAEAEPEPNGVKEAGRPNMEINQM